jgi:hypothetical protein
VITIYWDDHNPPHFHARYQNYKAIFDIKTCGVLAGTLPPKAMALIVEWVNLHRTELMENWERAIRRENLKQIQPLE